MMDFCLKDDEKVFAQFLEVLGLLWRHDIHHWNPSSVMRPYVNYKLDKDCLSIIYQYNVL